MAKKSTWEKRAKKVKKEEHLVLGGNTNRKKKGVKTEPSSKPKYTITRDSDGGEKTDRRPSNSGQKKGPFKGRKSFDDKRGDRREGNRGDQRGDKFKQRGSAQNSFRKDDKKKSHSKFLKDKHFDGLEQRGKGPDDLIRINKYLSMAGVCSRREADKFIADGLVTVNGEVVTELGTKVKPTDEVRYAGERIKAETLRYVLLNKPKDCITTLSDERGRSTVMGLVKNACRERIYPVGRLDRNTTGLLLLTNDGDMAKKLTHPSHEVRKVYHVITDKNVSIADLKRLESGIELEDGMAKADAALFAGDGSVRNEIGLEIHSGKNRIVRRMFSEMGYEVTRLDRAAFAGLSKKGLPRGRWRHLTEKEIGFLKML